MYEVTIVLHYGIAWKFSESCGTLWLYFEQLSEQISGFCPKSGDHNKVLVYYWRDQNPPFIFTLDSMHPTKYNVIILLHVDEELLSLHVPLCSVVHNWVETQCHITITMMTPCLQIYWRITNLCLRCFPVSTQTIKHETHRNKEKTITRIHKMYIQPISVVILKQ